jgi:hypothetical protein
MHAATRFLPLAVAALALAACHKNEQPPQDQNIAVDQPATNEMMANADIETLPPDESSGTSSTELATGTDNPDVNDLNASVNSD